MPKHLKAARRQELRQKMSSNARLVVECIFDEVGKRGVASVLSKQCDNYLNIGNAMSDKDNEEMTDDMRSILSELTLEETRVLKKRFGTEDVKCSFCDKPEAQVSGLVAAGQAGVFICGECVQRYKVVLDDE